MASIRKPTDKEERLLDLLVKKSNLALPTSWKDKLLVCNMNDGEMGSLFLYPQGKLETGRVLGKQVSDFQFKDIDGVDVVASLNVDTYGNLFELDVWKTNYEKLLKIPDL